MINQKERCLEPWSECHLSLEGLGSYIVLEMIHLQSSTWEWVSPSTDKGSRRGIDIRFVWQHNEIIVNWPGTESKSSAICATWGRVARASSQYFNTPPAAFISSSGTSGESRYACIVLWDVVDTATYLHTLFSSPNRWRHFAVASAR